ncbi:MAG: hypothetical protein ACK5Q5_02010 [Planctomycetaceae bacterium]
MPGPNRTDSLHLGFMTVVEVAGGTFVGGLLVTNKLGRPLEFQCTTPVKPNRTQEILYGPTLKPFLFSELIGKTLMERLQVKPQLLLIDQPDLLDLRNHVDLPVACLIVKGKQPDDLADQTRLALGNQQVRFHPDHPGDVETVREQSRMIPGDADTQEPVDRVREALQETLKGAA